MRIYEVNIKVDGRWTCLVATLGNSPKDLVEKLFPNYRLGLYACKDDFEKQKANISVTCKEKTNRTTYYKMVVFERTKELPILYTYNHWALDGEEELLYPPQTSEYRDLSNEGWNFKELFGNIQYNFEACHLASIEVKPSVPLKEIERDLLTLQIKSTNGLLPKEMNTFLKEKQHLENIVKIVKESKQRGRIGW